MTTVDDSSTNADDPDEDAFANALAGFDEMLRCGQLSSVAAGGLDSTTGSGAEGALVCLRLLERAFPRTAPDSRATDPASLGRFQLERVLGQGGFGIVYLARDPLLQRLVALKVPRLQTLGNQKLHARFVREARAAAALDHPHIVPILETGEIGAACYIASAYCDGGDLAQMIGTQAPFDARMAAKMIASVADAAHYSHMHGILHRRGNKGPFYFVQ